MDTRIVVAGEYKGSNQQMNISRQFVFVCRAMISRHANMPTAVQGAGAGAGKQGPRTALEGTWVGLEWEMGPLRCILSCFKAFSVACQSRCLVVA